MKKNMNKTFALFLTLALVMMGGMAFGQRGSGNSNNNNATTQHVTVGGSVFGGGNLAPVAGNSSVKLDQEDATIGTRVNGVLTEMTGDVYGGGALANVGTPGGNNTTTVDILNGIVEGNVYGGGLGDSIGNGYFSQFGNTQSVAAIVYGKVTVNIGAAPAVLNDPSIEPTGSATLNGDVFGCNNVNGTPKDDVRVNIWSTAHTVDNKYPIDNQGHLTVTLADLNVADPDASTYNNKFAINAVYGGGNKASYIPDRVTSGDPHSTTVYVYGCKYNTVKTVYGGGNAANVGTEGASGITAHTNILIDGGRFDRIFGGGNGYSAEGNHDKPYRSGDDCTDTPTDDPCLDYNPGADIYGTASTTINGGLFRQVFGGSNQYGNLNSMVLTIEKENCDTLLIYESFGGGNEAVINGNVSTNLGCSDFMIGNFYGGSNLADINGDVTLTVNGGNYINVFGGSKGRLASSGVTEKPANINGNVTLNLYGGTMVNAFGGNDAIGRIRDTITVNLLDAEDQYCPLVVDTIYGGGRDAEYRPDSIPGTGQKIVSPVVNLWHGTVGEENNSNEVTVPGCVFGGGKGHDAMVIANPIVNIGDVSSNTHFIKVLGHVFGGGNAAAVDGIDSVLMHKANSEVVNLFGGGNKADADTAVVWMKVNAEVDTIFGGGNLAGLTGTALVQFNNGKAKGGIYGGSNKEGTVSGDITVNVFGGQVGVDADHKANVHGGGYGQETKTGSNVDVTINKTGSVAPIIWGDVYGGSALGSVNNCANPQIVNSSCHTVVTLIEGSVNGDIYGGGLGQQSRQSIEAKVWSPVQVTVNGGSVNSVFGCNNENGAPQSTVQVDIDQTGSSMTVQNVYGGGNKAYYDGTPLVNIIAGTISENVYGGGNNITENNKGVNGTDVRMTGGTVSGNLYGGCNEKGTVVTTSSVIISNGTVGGSVFGGGLGVNTQVTGEATVHISGTGTTVTEDVFGGGDNGTVNGGTEVMIDLLPSVTTAPVTNITSGEATCGGNVISNGGGGEITERGICYSTNSNPTVDGDGCTKITNGTGTGNFTASMTSLAANTTYHVRSFATNSAGTSYGNEKTFTTASSRPQP